MIPLILQNKSDDLEQTPSTLEDLKFVLTTISDIKAMSLEVEDKIRDIQERYRTLSMYDIEVNSYVAFFLFIDEREICKNHFMIKRNFLFNY